MRVTDLKKAVFSLDISREHSILDIVKYQLPEATRQMAVFLDKTQKQNARGSPATVRPGGLVVEPLTFHAIFCGGCYGQKSATRGDLEVALSTV